MQNQTTNKIYETTSNLAVLPESEAPIAGKVVWWELHGDVALDSLNGALADYGLPEKWQITCPMPSQRLDRAMKTVAGVDEMVRPARKQGGLVLVKESADDALENAYEVEFRCWYEKGDNGALTLRCSNADDPRFEMVEAAWDRMADRAAVYDISSWLCRIAPQCASVPLRRTGGYHFIPATQLKTWQKVVDAITNTSRCLVYDLPVHSRATAIQAVLRSLVDEAEEAMGAIEDRVVGGMNARGAKSRQAELDRLLTKVGQYERSLGVTLSQVRTRADKLRNALAADLLTGGE